MLGIGLIIRTIRGIFLVIRLKVLFISLRKPLIGDFGEISRVLGVGVYAARVEHQ